MNDPTVFILIVIFAIVATANYTIRFCADEECDMEINQHAWWSKAKFLANQRRKYKQYCDSLSMKSEIKDLE